MSHFQASVILWTFTLISTILFLTISKRTDNTTSLYILISLFAVYMWISHILKKNIANLKEEALRNDSEATDNQKKITPEKVLVTP
jgi:UDP-GlcNAc:undecaprenyl-phosphate GlcNAc-1-phosphate transferase